MNWLAIVGAVALTLGVGFFLKLAFDNNWINETGRVLLGIAIGTALLGAGEYTARRYPLWASAVTGSGIGILYLAVYAAFAFYELIAAVPALVLLGAVVAGSDLLTLRYESRVIALLSIFGAFLTPMLLARELADPRLLLGYIILVDLGILTIAVLRNWRWYNLLGLLGSYMLVALWQTLLRPDDLIAAQFGLTAIFLIFVGATTLFHILWRRVPQQLDLSLMTLNAMLFYANTFGLLWDKYESWFGLITLTLAGLYALIGLAVIRRAGSPRETALFSFALALIFLTIAVPLQFSGSWITVAWAAEGAVLVWAGFFLTNWRARAFALLVFAAAGFRLLLFDTVITSDEFRILLNPRFPTFAASIAAFYVGAYVYWRARDRREEWERYILEVLAGAANLLTLWLLSAEVITYFDAKTPAAAFSWEGSESQVALWLTALWSVYAGGLLAISLATGSRLVRLGGLAIFTIPVLVLFAVDSTLDTIAPRDYQLILNYHFLTAAVVLAVSAFAAYLVYRQRHTLVPGERVLFPTLVAVANVVALWMLTDDLIRFFDGRELVLGTNQSDGLLLSLTALWATYAAGLLAVALWKRVRLVRLAGVALLAVTATKLVLVDTFFVEIDPHTFGAVLNVQFLVSTMVLATAVFAAWIYARQRHDLDESEERLYAALLVAANAIALWTLSTETLRYFDSREVISNTDLTSARHLTLTVLWAIYGVGVIGAGIARESAAIRRAGLGLLAVPVMKLFAFDVFLLERGDRVAAFVTLGVLLLGSGFAYNRFSDRIKGFVFGTV